MVSVDYLIRGICMPTYTGIDSEAFRHPLDQQAEQALRSLPGFDLLARKFVEFMAERPQYVYHMGNSIQAGPRQYSTVYGIFREVVRDLDVRPEPTVFVSQAPWVNASALGEEHPYIILNSGLLDLLNEAELRAVIAHELGHLKCGHTTLSQMASWALQAINILGNATFGFSQLLTTGLILAFFEWSRKAELSADRAALLVMDDTTPVMNLMMKLSGGSSRYGHEISLEEFIRQSQKYQELDQDGLNQVYKFLLYNNVAQGWFVSHPFTVERLHHVQQWFNSEEYRQIRLGNYPRSVKTAYDVASQTPQTPPPPTPPANEVEQLRQQLEQLQAEIERIKSQTQDE